MYLLISFIIAFVICSLSLTQVIQISKIKALVDVPAGRKQHEHATPNLGGIAIFLGIVIAMIFAASLTSISTIQAMLISCSIIWLVGIKDDLIPMKASRKMLLQIVAAAVIVYFELGWDASFLFPFGIYLPQIIMDIVSVLFICGLINAFNFVDGIDGLAGSLITISAIVLTTFFYIQADLFWASVAIAIAGSNLAFLRLNFYKAKVFMGDSGSTVLGLLMAVLCIQTANYGTNPASYAQSLIIVFGVVFIPSMDLIRVMMGRILRKTSIATPDRTHLHHLFVDQGISTCEACFWIGAVQITACVLAFQLALSCIIVPVLFVSVYAFMIAAIPMRTKGINLPSITLGNRRMANISIRKISSATIMFVVSATIVLLNFGI